MTKGDYICISEDDIEEDALICDIVMDSWLVLQLSNLILCFEIRVIIQIYFLACKWARAVPKQSVTLYE